jgi:hypothetical protein
MGVYFDKGTVKFCNITWPDLELFVMIILHEPCEYLYLNFSDNTIFLNPPVAFLCGIKSLSMSNRKKIIEIINKFPKVLTNIKSMLSEENVDYILDASGYSNPASLIMEVAPDSLLLNLKLSRNAAINLMGENMQESMALKMGMITDNSRAFYMSLCSTFTSEYRVDKSCHLVLIPEIVASRQLN